MSTKSGSVVDDILAKYGMRWEVTPYRIVNKYGIIVQKKTFNLRASTLKAQSECGKQRDIFVQPYPNTLANNKTS